MSLITGWNRSTWNSGSWNSPLPVVVTGVSAASAIGDETVSLPVSFSVTGVSAASAIGTATATGASTAIVTGVSAASAVGDPTLITNSILSPSGVSAASAVGLTQINFSFSVEGVSAAGLVNTVLIWDQMDDSQTSGFTEINASQTPTWTQIAA
jgi:hypothetical protein